MELIVPSLQTSSGVDEISLQKQQQQDEGKSQTVSNNRKAVVWPEFRVPLPDPVLGKKIWIII